MSVRTLLGRSRRRIVLNVLFLLIVGTATALGYTLAQSPAHGSVNSADHPDQPAVPAVPAAANQAFSQASQSYGVPTALLKAICYMEGRLSNNGGIPSEDKGYGCMHLVKNSNGDTLDSAAKGLGVSVSQLELDLPTNILGGALTLRMDALQLSSTDTLPTDLAGWYGAVAEYSEANGRALELMFADQVYKVLNEGFRAQTDNGEQVTLAPQSVTPDTVTAARVKSAAVSLATLPSGCTDIPNDPNVDYPGAIDCILSPASTYDCNASTSANDCNYTSSARPTSCTVQTTVTQPCNIDQIVIHDTDDSLVDALGIFQCPGTGTGCQQSSVQYLVDTDGTVYQVLPEQDIAYHDGNFWSNEHSIGIEHVGFDATGYKWYNSAQYLASAKLVAYLLKKYHLPLDRGHVVAHGMVPSSSLGSSPNHVDPGPYWLWDYYFQLISQQGVALNTAEPIGTITLRPATDQAPDGSNGSETLANYNFFPLYNGPSTSSGIIPQQGNNDPTDTSYNVEPGVSYYVLSKAQDSAGTGDTMYEIWYGEEDQVHTSPSSYASDAKLAWLAVPAGDGFEGQGLPVGPAGTSTRTATHDVKIISSGTGTSPVYGSPITNSQYVIGSAPAGAIFFTSFQVTEDNTGNVWYEINENHRQAFVPLNEVISFTPVGG